MYISAWRCTFQLLRPDCADYKSPGKIRFTLWLLKPSCLAQDRRQYSVQQPSFLGVAQYLHSSFGRLCGDVTVQERDSLALLLTASFMCYNMFGSRGKQTSHSLPLNTTGWSSKGHVSPISGYVQFNESHVSPWGFHSQKGWLAVGCILQGAPDATVIRKAFLHCVRGSFSL